MCSLHKNIEEGANDMISTEYWWEEIFSGPLAIGINEEKIHQLEDESFLYFNGQLPHEDEDSSNKETEN
jgi:hypothetical protein